MSQNHGSNVFCKHCERTYRSKASLKIHVEEAHENARKLHCRYCRTRHNRKELHQCERKAASKTHYICDICEKNFTSIKAIKDHMLFFHAKISDHKCKLCNKTFVSSNALNVHQRNRTCFK